MRLDALDCHGPHAPYLREVDTAQWKAEDEIASLRDQRARFPTYESVDLAVVEHCSSEFGRMLQTWRLQHG